MVEFKIKDLVYIKNYLHQQEYHKAYDLSKLINLFSSKFNVSDRVRQNLLYTANRRN